MFSIMKRILSPLIKMLSNVAQDTQFSLTPRARLCEEAVHDMSAEVHTEPHADDEDVHAGDLDGDAPPVHEPGHVHAGQQDAEHHEQWAAPAAQCDEGRHKDADDGDANIAQQLYTHYGVSLPVDVGESDGEAGVTPGDLRHNPLHLPHGGDPHRGGVKPEVGVGDGLQQHVRGGLPTHQGRRELEMWLQMKKSQFKIIYQYFDDWIKL